MMTPEETVKQAVLDALANDYEYHQIIGWVEEATDIFEEPNG